MAVGKTNIRIMHRINRKRTKKLSRINLTERPTKHKRNLHENAMNTSVNMMNNITINQDTKNENTTQNSIISHGPKTQKKTKNMKWKKTKNMKYWKKTKNTKRKKRKNRKLESARMRKQAQTKVQEILRILK
jgi:hypothetical protein